MLPMKIFISRFKNVIKMVLIVVTVIAWIIIVWTIRKQNQALETEYQVIQQLRAENENLVLINDALIKRLKRCHQFNVNLNVNSSDLREFNLLLSFHPFVFDQTHSFSSNMFNYMQ